MDRFKVTIGEQHYDGSTGTPTKNTYRDVEFEGEKLAERKMNSVNDSGNDKTLFKVAEDDLPQDCAPEECYLVHVYSWSRWQGVSSRRYLDGPMDPHTLTDEHPQLARKANVDETARLEDVA